MDLAQARYNMIEQQIRPWDVLDGRVLELMNRVPREDFVPREYVSVAYADIEIPLGHGQVMMPPKVEGRMLQALDARPGDKVLEVGTGSGYVTALIASCAKQVFSVDIRPHFVDRARSCLAARGLGNVTLEAGDAARGWDRHGPYDVIAVTGSVPVLNDAFLRSLKPGGRLFVIAGQNPVMEALLFTRTGEHDWNREVLFETSLSPLDNAPPPRRFVF